MCETSSRGTHPVEAEPRPRRRRWAVGTGWARPDLGSRRRSSRSRRSQERRTPSVLIALVAVLAAVGPGGALVAQPNAGRCAQCVFGPVTLDAGGGQPAVFSFAADIRRSAELWVHALGRPGIPAAFRLNGGFVGGGQGGLQPLAGGLTRYSVDLRAFNVLEVFVGPDTAGRIRVQIRYRGSDPPIEDTACPDGGPSFSQLPAPLEQLFGIVPLGSVNPAEHTFPTHHVYAYAALPGMGGPPAPVEIFAPGRMKLGGAIRHVADDGSVDYELHFKPCREVRFYVIHVTRLDPVLARRLVAFDDLCLGSFCAERTNLLVAAGQRLGVFDSTRNLAFDLGLVDRRRPANAFVNPDRYRLPESLLAGLTPEQLELAELIAPDDLHQHCPLDYFAPPLRASMEALLGSFDGSVRRTALPLCGEFMQDVAGGAPGNWFRDAEDTVFDESRGVALARNHVDPALPRLSIGTEVPDLPPGAYDFAVGADPSTAVNTEFDEIVPGTVYCYEGITREGSPLAGIVLVELFTSPGGAEPDRLRIEYDPAPPSCPASPGFSAAAVVFQR